MNKGFTTAHFIVGDEVYLVNGNGEPFGMVIKIGDKNVYVRTHNKNKIYLKKPSELYLGKEWQYFNKKH